MAGSAGPDVRWRGWRSTSRRRAIVRGRRGNVRGLSRHGQHRLTEEADPPHRARATENRRYTSAIKTYFRRLQAAVEGGDDDAADAEHQQLIRLVDKAVKRGALHKNAGARKKSRAAKLRRGASA